MDLDAFSTGGGSDPKLVSGGDGWSGDVSAGDLAEGPDAGAFGVVCECEWHGEVVDLGSWEEA